MYDAEDHWKSNDNTAAWFRLRVAQMLGVTTQAVLDLKTLEKVFSRLTPQQIYGLTRHKSPLNAEYYTREYHQKLRKEGKL